MNKPVVTISEYKSIAALLAQQLDSDKKKGQAKLIALATQAIGVKKVGLLLKEQDPVLSKDQIEKARQVIEKKITPKQIISVLIAVLGEERVREILAYLKEYLSGSTDSPIPPTTDTGYASFEMDPRKLVIAGVDRNWPDYNPAELCRAVVQAGTNAISIEMVANDRWFTLGASKAKAPFLALLTESRKRKETMFISVWNDHAPVKFIPTHAEKFLQYVLEAGPEGVIVQSVGETHTPEGAAFEKSALAKLKAAGFKTCYNGNNGRPNNNGGCDMRAWHTGGVNGSSSAPSGSIEITDHGQKIDYCQFVNAQRVAEIAANAKSRGAGFGFYLYVSMSDHNSPSSLPLDKVIPAWREMARIYKSIQMPTPSKGKDEVDISDVIEASSGNIINEQSIEIVAVLKSAKVEGGNVRLDYDIPEWFWSSKSDHLGFPRLYAYWEVNDVVWGGHFDWLRFGQTVKTLENVFGDYFRIHPPAGAKLCFAIVANNKSGRTQVVRVK